MGNISPVIGRTLILVGIILVVVGLFLTYAPRIPLLGRLPGDIYYRKDNFTVYFPITTSIIISIVISLILYLLTRR